MIKLHDYQEKAKEFCLARDKSALWLTMGAGKTVVTLSVMAEWLDTMAVERVLIISTLRVVKSVWQQENAKWGILNGYKWAEILGDAKTRKAAADSDAQIYLVNVDNVEWLAKTYGLSNWKWDCVILDESTLFKSPSSKRFKALKSVQSKIRKMTQLSGTPATNGIADLYTQAYLLDGGARLGRTKSMFEAQFFNRGYQQWDVTPKPGAMEAITEKLSDIVMTLEPSDYVMPEPYVHNRIQIDLGANLATYKRFEKAMVMQISSESEITAVNAAVLSNKLAQLANGQMYDDERASQTIHTCKLDVLQEILETSGNVILVYRYQHDLAAIRQRIKLTEVREPGAIEAWNRGEIKVLAVHPRSAGHGLNLQAGGHSMLWYGPTWSLEEHAQTIARVYRQGQKHTVIINSLIATDTIDESICLALETKDNGQKTLINYLKTLQ